jgi:hypothetical protein
MTLELKDPEVNKLVRELAHTTGETFPQAVMNALWERPGAGKSAAAPAGSDRLVRTLRSSVIPNGVFAVRNLSTGLAKRFLGRPRNDKLRHNL